MSSIAGFVDFKNNARNYIEVYSNMINSLVKRGPDDAGIFISENVCLMNTRLEIVKSPNSKQPAIYTIGDEKIILVLDGEIYNTKELTEELKTKGHDVDENADSQVLLHCYVVWGEKCIEKINGNFSFAIYDSRINSLFVVRDRLGVRPLFYCHIGSSFIFSSEIKGLLNHPLVRPEIDNTSILEIMLLGPGRTPGYGVFKNISELKPGHCGCFSEKGFDTYSYWQLEAKEHKETFEETMETVKSLLTDSIKSQLKSDVPLCAFLSGGLDSSVITAISGVKKTFSIDYAENDVYFKSNRFQPEGDNKYIEIVSKFLGTDHTVITIKTDDLVNSIFDAVKARDLPGMADVDGSIQLFCREVKKHNVGVALSGECADELFGGYPWYRDSDLRSAEGFPWSQSTQYRASFIRDEFLQNTDPNEYVRSKYINAISNVSTLDDDPPLEKRMKEMFRLNTDWFMQTLIDRTDRASSQEGFSVRIPFCDYKIAEYLYNTPWEFKNFMGREKGLLRAAMGGIIPDEALWRKKSPFPKTHNPEYLNKVTAILLDILSSPNSPLLDILKKSALETLLTADVSQPWYGQLMTTPQTIAYFIQLNFWLAEYKISIV